MHRLCAVIPVRDQEFTVTDVVTRSIVAGLDCVLVDDGATPACRQVLNRLTHQDRIFLARRSPGDDESAVLTGLREARQLGYTHAVHVAADGRHDPDDVPRFIRQSMAAPDALICGYRVSASSVPTPGRWRDTLTRLLVALLTLSLDIRDTYCSLRVYPLAPVLRLAGTGGLARRAGFETEVLVRMHWRRQPIYWLPVKTRAPVHGAAGITRHEEHA
jgi:hypothetical protein